MIVDSDAFLDMPTSTQALYFHLGMRADDEGFINNPKKVQRMVGANEDDLRLLITKKFIIAFDTGVIVVKHWKMHNSLRADRVKKTVYSKELSQLEMKENGAYTLKNKPLEIMVDNSPSNGNQLSTTCPHSIDKIRLDKIRLDKDSIGEYEGEPPQPPPTPKEQKPIKRKYGDYEKVRLDDNQLEKLKAEFPDWQERIQRLDDYVASTGKTYKDHLATIRNWAKRDGATKKEETQPVTNNPFLQRKLERMAAEKIDEQRRD